jgi:hypothetical protein
MPWGHGGSTSQPLLLPCPTAVTSPNRQFVRRLESHGGRPPPSQRRRDPPSPAREAPTAPPPPQGLTPRRPPPRSGAPREALSLRQRRTPSLERRATEAPTPSRFPFAAPSTLATAPPQAPKPQTARVLALSPPFSRLLLSAASLRSAPRKTLAPVKPRV